MKSQVFQQQIRGAASCTKIIMKDNKGFCKLSLNDTLFADTWFSRVKTAEEEMAEGVDYCGPVKTIHKLFSLDTQVKLTKQWSVGSHLVMKSGLS